MTLTNSAINGIYPYLQHVDEATGVLLTAEVTFTAVFDLGIDWGQPYHSKQYCSTCGAVATLL